MTANFSDNKSFLIYLFFNKDFIFNPLVSGALQAITPDQLGNLAVTNVKFPENGYLYVYVCNESPIDVYFDNLQIIHTTNPLTEVNDYFPFGMLSVNCSSTGLSKQNYKYNGKELQKDLSFNVEDYGARQYDPVIGRFCIIDRFSEKYFNLTNYQYGGNNPIKNIDINGDSLMEINLNGYDNENPQLKQRQYYVDSKIGYSMKAFVDDATQKFSNLSVNNIYRPNPSSEIKTANTKAKDLSRHQGGFAIDLNGVKNLSKGQLKLLNKIAKEYGLSPLVKQANDLPHFDANPTNYGYESLKEAVDENKAQYDNIKKGKTEPEKFDQTKYEDYKQKKENENKK